MNAVRFTSAIVAATGLVTLAIGYFLLQSRLETVRKWKPVEAEVIRSWMEEHQSGAASEQSTSYSAHYELAYTVDGKPVRSMARSEDPLAGQPDLVRTRLDRHRPGTRAAIHVNPDDPTQVRLNLGMNVNTFALPLWLLLAGAALLSMSIALWFMGTPSVPW